MDGVWIFRKNKEKETAKIPHNIREIIIWQIHSNFAPWGSPCLDTAGKDSSVTGDPESFFERTFSLPFYPYIEQQKNNHRSVLYYLYKMNILFAMILAAFSQLSEFKFPTTKWSL